MLRPDPHPIKTPDQDPQAYATLHYGYTETSTVASVPVSAPSPGFRSATLGLITTALRVHSNSFMIRDILTFN